MCLPWIEGRHIGLPLRIYEFWIGDFRFWEDGQWVERA